MKNQNLKRLLLPIGLLLISASFIIKHFMDVPDFIDGFLKGVGIGLLILALRASQKMRKAN